jgi:hypothetical protein
MSRLSWTWVLGVVLTYVPDRSAEVIAPDLAKINDGRIWKVINGGSNTAVKDGKSVVRLYPKGGNKKGSNISMALVESLEFANGTIEVDLRGRGKQASFLGVAFGVADGKTYEAVYFRPFRFQSNDPVQRTHAVQYIASPDHPWDKLRAQAPGVYESAVSPIPDPAGWFHVRIDVKKKQVSVFVNDAKDPSLVVERLRGVEKGRVGLWVDSQPGYFADLRILPTTP